MMTCVVIEVFARNVIHLPTAWAEESSRLCCVYAVFLGATSAWYRGTHIAINVLPRRLKGRSHLILKLIIEILAAVFVVCTFVGTLKIMVISRHSTSTALEISISYFYLALALGGAGIVIFHAHLMAHTIGDLFGSAHSTEG